MMKMVPTDPFRGRLLTNQSKKTFKVSKKVFYSAVILMMLCYIILINISITKQATLELELKNIIDTKVSHRLQSMTESESESVKKLTGAKASNINYKISLGDDRVKDNDAWPSGCTWKCYLQNNRDLWKTFGDSHRAAKKHWIENGEREGRSCECTKRKVILLTGPHKAASTSIQWISTVYASMKNIQWGWLAPASYFEGNWKWSQIKAFAPFAFTYFGTKDKANMTFEEFKLSYKEEFEKLWYDNRNIILGSESIDLAIDPRNKGKDLIKEILTIMPKDAIDSITTLVIYRSTRISHLKSLWKEIGSWHNTTFYEFLLQEERSAFRRFYHSINSLALASAFLEKGIHVKLLDLSGVKTDQNNEELYTIFGCDVMELKCIVTKDNVRMPNAISEHSAKDAKYLQSLFTADQNVKQDSNYILNVTDYQMAQVDKLLIHHECSYENIIRENKHLEILNGNKIFDHMKDCRTHFAGKPLSEEDLFKAIRSVMLSTGNGVKDMQQQIGHKAAIVSTK